MESLNRIEKVMTKWSEEMGRLWREWTDRLEIEVGVLVRTRSRVLPLQ